MYTVHFAISHRPLSCKLASYKEALAWVHKWNDDMEAMGIDLIPLVIVKG